MDETGVAAPVAGVGALRVDGGQEEGVGGLDEPPLPGESSADRRGVPGGRSAFSYDSLFCRYFGQLEKTWSASTAKPRGSGGPGR